MNTNLSHCLLCTVLKPLDRRNDQYSLVRSVLWIRFKKKVKMTGRAADYSANLQYFTS